MGGIVLLAEVLCDGAGFLDDEVAVFEGGGFAEGCWNFGTEIGGCETIGGAVGGDEAVGKGESGEEPGDADGAGGVEKVESHIWGGGHGEGGMERSWLGSYLARQPVMLIVEIQGKILDGQYSARSVVTY